MRKTLLCIASAMLSLQSWGQPTPLFSENFESGSLANWTTSGSSTFSISTVTNQVPGGGTYSAMYPSSAGLMYAKLPSGLGITDQNDSCRFSVWIFDWATNNNLRCFATVRSYTGGSYNSGSYNQILAIGTYNDATIPPAFNSKKYCGRIVAGTPSGWFSLTSAPDKTAGWHHFAIERGFNSANQLIYKFYQDEILGRVFTNTGSQAVWDSVTAGLGAGSSTGAAYYDGFEVVQGQAFIGDEPQSSTNLIGSTATFSVGTSGSADSISYWWFKDGALLSDNASISGSRSSMLYINNVQLTDSGWYSVMVSNVWGARTSAVPARLEVGGVNVVVHPTNQVVNIGSNDVSFYVEAVGLGTLRYQWLKDGVIIPGATAEGSSSLYTIPTVGVGDLASNPGYTCLITNDMGSQTVTLPATLLSNAPPWMAPRSGMAVDLGAALQISMTVTDDYSSLGLFQTFEATSAGGASTFQAPAFSGSAATYVDAATSRSYVTNANIPSGNIRVGTNAYFITVTFTNETKVGWDRLTTSGNNPIVSFQGPLKFDIWTDRPMGVSVGLHESNPTGPIGANGGTSSSIENAGVATGGSIPNCIYTNAGGVWTNFTYDLADTLWPPNPDDGFIGWAESYIHSASLVGGNGVLDLTTGKGVLENLGLCPADGLGTYRIYVDNLQSLGPNWLRFSLDVAPPDATIDPFTGVIKWTVPTTPCSTNFTVRATDHLGLYVTQSFTVSAPAAPAREPLRYQVINGQLVLSWTNAVYSLESSGDLGSGYAAISGAFSPYTNSIGSSAKYFRLHWKQ